MSGSLDVLVLSMGGPVVTSTGRTMGDVVAERVLSLAASLGLASVGVEFGWHVCKDELKTCVTHTRVRREKKRTNTEGTREKVSSVSCREATICRRAKPRDTQRHTGKRGILREAT